VMTVLTQVRVDENDPAFQNPTKPVGPFYSSRDAETRRRQFGWTMVEDAARGYRRTVPSPEPVEVFEQDIIRKILGLGMIVIAAGGGGIPVIERKNYLVLGAEAVIDKDRASALLASELKTDLFVISTDADQVYLDFRKPTRRGIRTATADEMAEYQRQGHFPAGSMGPKVEAAIRYLRRGGKEVIITSPERLLDAVDGKAGTHIVP
jgi:carbamate kinase